MGYMWTVIVIVLNINGGAEIEKLKMNNEDQCRTAAALINEMNDDTRSTILAECVSGEIN